MSHQNQPHVEINMTTQDTDEPDLGTRRSRNIATQNNTPHRTLSPNHISTPKNRDRSPNRLRRSSSIRESEFDVLLKTEEFDRRQPPMAEIDDDGVDDDIRFTTEPRHGIDDRAPRHKSNGNNNNNNNNGNGDHEIYKKVFEILQTGVGTTDSKGVPRVIPDVNAYQQKKTLASGMMDLALLSANANQLRYVIETFAQHPFSYVSMLFIGISVVFQIAVGVGLILNSRYNVKNDDDICKADRINNLTVIGIFIITVVNVFVAAFGIPLPVAEGTTKPT